jgi:hypothetical protein
MPQPLKTHCRCSSHHKDQPYLFDASGLCRNDKDISNRQQTFTTKSTQQHQVDDDGHHKLCTSHRKPETTADNDCDNDDVTTDDNRWPTMTTVASPSPSQSKSSSSRPPHCALHPCDGITVIP